MAGVSERYLCRHRSPCYAQEDRLPAPFVCTYLACSRKGSGRPFRFILNHSEAVAANVYLMLYPKDRMQRAMGARPELKRGIRKRLNGINPQTMLDEGRVYGGGLHKLEPKGWVRLRRQRLQHYVPSWRNRSGTGKQRSSRACRPVVWVD